MGSNTDLYKAAYNDCSVSELIRRWLEEYRAKEAGK